MKSDEEKLKIIDNVTSDEVSLWHKESDKRLIEQLKIKIESFSELKKNWGSYNEDEITMQSIMTAIKYIDTIPNVFNQIINVHPMRDGGVQINIGEFVEVEIMDNNIKEIFYDKNLNIQKTNTYILL